MTSVVQVEINGRILEVHCEPLFEPSDEIYGEGDTSSLDLDIREILWLQDGKKLDIYWAIDVEGELFNAIYEAAINAVIEEAKEEVLDYA